MHIVMADARAIQIRWGCPEISNGLLFLFITSVISHLVICSGYFLMLGKLRFS
jgi:hypothetical protein